ncbi:no significant blast hit [Histoplasma capsulatum var. duboisii H88]|uniref:No significant blast hit n=1 Tax=Ajellomyces capsulatus (strain H88) TaxID=544711 RepID=A0A8A1LNF1_AJEC8|nr:no significant blast hit [Histoplasma capsulatum var. duboisii H88]
MTSSTSLSGGNFHCTLAADRGLYIATSPPPKSGAKAVAAPLLLLPLILMFLVRRLPFSCADKKGASGL